MKPKTFHGRHWQLIWPLKLSIKNSRKFERPQATFHASLARSTRINLTPWPGRRAVKWGRMCTKGKWWLLPRLKFLKQQFYPSFQPFELQCNRSVAKTDACAKICFREAHCQAARFRHDWISIQLANIHQLLPLCLMWEFQRKSIWSIAFPVIYYHPPQIWGVFLGGYRH